VNNYPQVINKMCISGIIHIDIKYPQSVYYYTEISRSYQQFYWSIRCNI